MDAPEVATFKARGAGGAEFVFDELAPGTARAEILGDQIRRGDLVLIDDDGNALTVDERDAFLAPLDLPVADTRDVREGRSGPRDRTGEAAAAVPAEPSVEEVPDAKIDDVVDWVRGAPAGDDPTEGWVERAQEALDAEVAKGDDARKTLVEKLEDIVASAAAEPETG